jgi:hypothetical protein
MKSSNAASAAVIPENREFMKDAPVKKPAIQINRAIKKPPIARIWNSLTRKGKALASNILARRRKIFFIISLGHARFGLRSRRAAWQTPMAAFFSSSQRGNYQLRRRSGERTNKYTLRMDKFFEIFEMDDEYIWYIYMRERERERESKKCAKLQEKPGAKRENT